MQINEIILQDFRNYDHLQLQFTDNINVFIGENAQGKTNLMEAINVLAMSKSHRTPRDKELIRWDQPFAKIEGHLTNKHGPLHMEIVLSKKEKKMKVNHLEKKRLSDYLGICNVVMFAPEDLNIVKGSPQIRRRFLDLEMGQIHAVYLYYLSQYHKLLKQRNKWLKDVQQKITPFDMTMYDVITDQLVQMASHVIEKRYAFIDKLQEWAKPIHHEISRGLEKLEIKYRPSTNVSETMDLSTMIVTIKEQFLQIREKELTRGTTLIGPHRDDIQFFVNDRDVQTYGSQGQQRTTALSVKLAEIQLIYEKVNEYPILLLDDVLSELDDYRQSHLLNTIQGKVQTFVTTTSVEGIDHRTLKEAQMYHVHNGTVQMI